MPIPLPNLDDRRWAELVDEGRALIPAYAPEWTDHNVHDPGLTVMELLAWLTEQDVYRLNRITDAHRQQLLQLIDVLQQPPRPARTFVVIEPNSSEAEPAHVPRHTELEASEQGLKFRTTSSMQALPTKLESLISRSAQRVTDWTEAVIERDGSFTPFGADPQPGNSLQIGLRSFESKHPVRLSLYFVSDLDCQSDEDLVRSDHESAHHHSVRLAWDVRVKTDETTHQWQELPSEAATDHTRGLTVSGSIKLELPAEAIAETQVGRSQDRVHLRCRIVSGSYDAAPRVKRLYCNGVAVEQAESAGPSLGLILPPELESRFGATQSAMQLDDQSLAQIADQSDAQKAVTQIAIEQAGVDWLVLRHAALETHRVKRYGVPEEVSEVRVQVVDDEGEPLPDLHLQLRRQAQVSSASGWATFAGPINGASDTVQIHFHGGWLVVPVFGDNDDWPPAGAWVIRVQIRSMQVVLPASKDREHEDDEIRLNVLAVVDLPIEESRVQLVVVEAEKALAGDGTPLQRHAPKVSTPRANFSLYEFDSRAKHWKTWECRRDLRASRRTQPHYLLDDRTGEVSFGDGEHGRLIERDHWLLGVWTTTQGTGGNLSAGQIDDFSPNWKNEIRVPHLTRLQQRWTVEQPEPARGGKDSETLPEAAARALRIIGRTERAVTLADYERLARETPYTCIARAKAWARVHPDFPCLQAPGLVTLTVLPHLPKAKPTPSPELLDQVSAHLRARRIIGTRVEVVAPPYITVTVQARARACPRTDPVRITEQIIEAINAFWHPLTGGSDGKGWPFGRDVYRSEVLQVIDEVPGVDHVLELRFEDEAGQNLCGNICVPDQGLVAAGNHDIQVLRAEE